jgi:phosphatidate cytidylyltransferase
VQSNHLQRILSAIVMVPTVLAVVIFAPPILLGVAVAALTIGTLREYFDIAEKTDLAPLRRPGYMMAALMVMLPAFGKEISLESLFLIAILALIIMSRELASTAAGAASTLFGVLYIGLPFAMLVQLRLVQLRGQPRGHLLALYVLIMIWIGDTAAYYGGRFLGRGGIHKLAARISPGKTWEGTITSLVVVMAAGYFYMKHFFPEMTVAASLFIAATVNIAGQIGDLAESALKRGAGVKDSGTLLPGHGGLLDRVDALLFAIPVLWYDMKVVAFFYR